MNNKKGLITLTTLACLLLLAQSVQADEEYVEYEHRIFPKNLSFIPHYGNRSKLNAQSKFCWRYIQGEQGTFKVLTVEQGTADLESDKNESPEEYLYLLPHKLNAKDDFENDLEFGRAYFNLREFNRNGEIYNVVTIEQLTVTDYQVFRTNEISPFDLVGTGDFRSEINEQTKFNKKRVAMKDNYVYYAVVLEN